MMSKAGKHDRKFSGSRTQEGLRSAATGVCFPVLKVVSIHIQVQKQTPHIVRPPGFASRLDNLLILSNQGIL